MSLFRPTSGGPGGLSINTSSANMFGSTSQTPASGSLFGSTATTNANTSTPKPSLFGNTLTVPASQPQQSASLFGGASTMPAQTQQTPSLFGATSQTTSQPAAQSTSIFGTAQPQTQQTQATGGLFGASNAASQPNAGTTGAGAGASTGIGGGLFGNGSAAQPAAGTTGTSLFGQPTQQRPGAFGIFGQSQQQQQQQPQQAAIGVGGTSSFGLSMGQPNAQPAVPGVRIDISNLKGTTRFNDLQEDLQKVIEQADRFVQEQQRRKEEIDAFMSGHRELLESLPEDVNHVSRKYDGARNALESAAESIEAARLLVKQDADSARLSFRAIDNLKLPQQYHTSGFWSPRQQASGNANAEIEGQDLVGFFSQAADEMTEQMKKYERNLTEIEVHMHGVSDGLVEQLTRTKAAKNGGPGGPGERIEELVAVLRDFEQGILKVANDVGSAREGVTRLQVGDFMNYEHNTNGVY
ncbi:hypothetical protein F5Y17DRAFT_362167 [Xylariaceae sp. FL0594]|nr:hypothetical protein F5Y17DRAFT_362167 [Xylariaceae sp. FL0594]